MRRRWRTVAIRQGRIATARSGPPEPPRDLHRERDDPGARLGQPGEVREVLESDDTGRRGDAVDREILRRSMVDRGRVDSEGADASLFHEQFRGLPSVRREVELRGVVRRVVPEVLESIRPAGRPTGSEKDDRALRNRPVRGLPGLHVRGREAVVAVVLRFRGNVDDDGGRDEPPDGDGLRALPAFEEVDRRVEVRAAVLGRRKELRRIEEAAGRLSLRQSLQLEGGR